MSAPASFEATKDSLLGNVGNIGVGQTSDYTASRAPSPRASVAPTTHRQVAEAGFRPTRPAPGNHEYQGESECICLRPHRAPVVNSAGAQQLEFGRDLRRERDFCAH